MFKHLHDRTYYERELLEKKRLLESHAGFGGTISLISHTPMFPKYVKTRL